MRAAVRRSSPPVEAASPGAVPRGGRTRKPCSMEARMRRRGTASPVHGGGAVRERRVTRWPGHSSGSAGIRSSPAQSEPRGVRGPECGSSSHPAARRGPAARPELSTAPRCGKRTVRACAGVLKGFAVGFVVQQEGGSPPTRWRTWARRQDGWPDTATWSRAQQTVPQCSTSPGGVGPAHRGQRSPIRSP